MYLFGLGVYRVSNSTQTAQSYVRACILGFTVARARVCVCASLSRCTATPQSPGDADVGLGVGRPGDGALRGNRGRVVRESGGPPPGGDL